MKDNSAIKMTEGSLWKNIFFFSIPLMCSNLLQVLFNMSDIAVVGRFAGNAALGSVGSCATAVSLFTGLLIGMGGGINAIAARHEGANDRASIQKTVHTSFIISLIYGLCIMAVGLCLIDKLLLLLNTKDELLEGAILYMRVYLLGTPALAIYNFGNGILSAAGDSKRPLYYLLTAGIVNILLNLFFVIICQLSVLGVALASAISQYLSAFLILRRLFTCDAEYAMRAGNMRMDGAIAKTVLLLGLPSAFQNAIFAVANLFIQAAVNSFDTIMVEGNSAAANTDALVYDMMAAFYVACTTFMGQNLGAGKKDRVLKSYRISVAYSFLIAFVSGILLFLLGKPFLTMFTQDAAVIDAGLKRLSIMAFSYCISAFMDCPIAASRGLGKTVIPTIIVISGSCVFRIAWVYTVFAELHTIPSLYLLYPCSWALTALFEILYLHYILRKQFAASTIPA